MRTAAHTPHFSAWRVASVLQTAIVGIALSVAAGALIAQDLGPAAIVATLWAGALAIGIYRWRLSIYGLIAYIPLSGIPILATYPNTGPAVLLKDFLFVIPAYLGFAGYVVVHRPRFAIPKAVFVLLGMLAVVVVAQTVVVASRSPLIALIGLKVWLFYVPLLFLGYCLVATRRHVFSLLGAIAASAVLPAVIGLLEAVVIYGGGADVVYRAYGDAAAAATQNYTTFTYEGGGSLRRIPSTFSFVAQYATFLLCAVAAAYAWTASPYARRRAPTRVLLPLLILAGLLTGARAAFFLFPALIVVILLLDRRIRPARLAIPFVAIALVFTTIGAAGGNVFGNAIDAARFGFRGDVVAGTKTALAEAPIGLGVGTNTGAARYAVAEGDELAGGLGGQSYESFYVKTLIELGLPGLAVVLLLVGVLLLGGLRHHAAVSDPALRLASASLLGFLLVTTTYLVKSSYIHLDPLNVYFWLLAGVLLRVWTLDDNATGVGGER